jgi:hypothetical protein
VGSGASSGSDEGSFGDSGGGMTGDAATATGEEAGSSFFGRVLDGRGGAVGSYFSTKLRGKMPSCLVPASSTYFPPYQSASSSSVTVMIWPMENGRSSSWPEA